MSKLFSCLCPFSSQIYKLDPCTKVIKQYCKMKTHKHFVFLSFFQSDNANTRCQTLFQIFLLPSRPPFFLLLLSDNTKHALSDNVILDFVRFFFFFFFPRIIIVLRASPAVTNAPLLISALSVDLTSIFRWSSPNMQCNKTFTRDMVNLFRPYAAFAADRVLIIKHLFVTCLNKTPPRPSNNASFLPRPQIN